MRIREVALCLSIGFSIVLLAAGCASKEQAPQPQEVVTPRFVNNLSSLSSQPVHALNNPAAAYAVTQRPAASPEGGRKVYLQAPGVSHDIGTDTNPGTISLLNRKADRYAIFANDLANHLYAEVRRRELDPEVARVKLPNDLKPVIITATLTKQGHLTELVLEQHSGKTMVDSLFINACKKALWSRNPPAGALSANGTYQVRVEGRLTTWASVGDGVWRYKTWIGIGLM